MVFWVSQNLIAGSSWLSNRVFNIVHGMVFISERHKKIPFIVCGICCLEPHKLKFEVVYNLNLATSIKRCQLQL